MEGNQRHWPFHQVMALAIGAGVGAGFMTRGVLHQRAGGAAGEIGHTRIGRRTTSSRPGGGDAVGRLGNQSRAPGLARQPTRPGDASRAAKDPLASFVSEFGAAPGPPRQAPVPDRATRLTAVLEAIAAGAEAGMADHELWVLARRRLEGKLTGRRSSSRLPALAEFVLARPIASAGMCGRSTLRPTHSTSQLQIQSS